MCSVLSSRRKAEGKTGCYGLKDRQRAPKLPEDDFSTKHSRLTDNSISASSACLPAMLSFLPSYPVPTLLLYHTSSIWLHPRGVSSRTWRPRALENVICATLVHLHGIQGRFIQRDATGPLGFLVLTGNRRSPHLPRVTV